MSTTPQYYHELGSPAQPVSQPTGRSSRRLFVAVSTHLALVGFLVMPLAFGNAEQPSHVNKTATVVVASVLIGIAHSLSLLLFLLYFDERMFLIQSLLVPALISNVFALFNVVINILCRDLLPLGLLETLSLSFAAAFAFLYALAALWLYSRDINGAIGESNRGTILLTDEEMQRHQLQRLLDQNSSRKSLSPRAAQKTYRINHPDRLNSFLPPPQEGGYFS